jgi:hypothetical protein
MAPLEKSFLGEVVILRELWGFFEVSEIFTTIHTDPANFFWFGNEVAYCQYLPVA